jgi:Flp pilus assembly protein TadG
MGMPRHLLAVSRRPSGSPGFGPARGDSRRESERGQAAIEIGLTVAMLFGLIFLVMDLSMLLFLKSNLQEAVRDGVRTGTTGNIIGVSPYLNDSIRQSVQEHSLGLLIGDAGACKIQVDYFDPATGAASQGTQGDVLVVSVNGFNYTPLGAVLRRADPFQISVSSSDIVEKCPAGGCPITVNPEPLSCP